MAAQADNLVHNICKALNSKKGFSLVELLVVVAIIGVLAGVGVVGYDRYVENAKRKVFDQNVETVTRAIDFEYTVIKNELSSAIKEVDRNGNMIDGSGMTTTSAGAQRKINSETSCENFLYSVKEHFKEFKNPWGTKSTVMITIDTKAQSFHKKGMLQLVCHRSSGFTKGWNCKIQDSLFHILAYYQDGLVKDSNRSDTNTRLGGTATYVPTGNIASQWWNKGDNNPPAAERSNPNLAWLTESAGIARCGSTGYTTSEINVSSDANY